MNLNTIRRRSKAFTLVELLIVVAILGILAAVVIPSVLGLMGRGASQAYETDQKTIQLAAAAFYADPHSGCIPVADGGPAWGDEAATTSYHYYPTPLAYANAHRLAPATDLIANPPDAENPMMVLGNTTTPADLIEIQNHAIWMGLLVNADGTHTSPGGTIEPLDVSPIEFETALYLQEVPESASPTNGGEGQYVWIVGANGNVYGCYEADGNWYAGFSGSYP